MEGSFTELENSGGDLQEKKGGEMSSVLNSLSGLSPQRCSVGS